MSQRSQPCRITISSFDRLPMYRGYCNISSCEQLACTLNAHCPVCVANSVNQRTHTTIWRPKISRGSPRAEHEPQHVHQGDQPSTTKKPGSAPRSSTRPVTVDQSWPLKPLDWKDPVTGVIPLANLKNAPKSSTDTAQALRNPSQLNILTIS